MPEQPVTLTTEQIAGLNRALGEMPHDIYNHLSLVVAAGELLRTNPELAESLMVTLLGQPARISQALQKLSTEFEKTRGLRPDQTH